MKFWHLSLISLLSTGVAFIGTVSCEPLLRNGSFEDVRQAKPGADGLVSGWTLGEPPLVPSHWQLNTAYPGRLAVGTSAPRSGKRFVRITAKTQGSTHLYQMCKGLKAGKWYRVSARMRGGPFTDVSSR